VHRLQISPVSWLSGFASSHLPTTLPFLITIRSGPHNERFVAVACELLIPPYSRAAATVSNAKKLPWLWPVFPSTKSAVIVVCSKLPQG